MSRFRNRLPGGHFGTSSSVKYICRFKQQYPVPGAWPPEYSLRPVSLDTVAVGAKQLQVIDVVLTAAAPGDDVVHLEEAEGELAPASVASALLLAEQDVLVLAVRNRRVDVGANGDVSAGRDESVVEQVAHGLLEAHVDQLNGLG